ncbi:mitochondrial 54S ribosomal protein uL1m KNAG_0H03210 [Huiozyma naganishii CBS 8797]|uniref:Ribosomal protein n=1 Tax=Huiozyma naganishii (strain ATCC MYA-139 / BCRC 22969 / CBS 8797 / KCTC 17520 / NBRC 10181 / NCYC 3082 / Yp74L-3) TaxID=1071383 RepID=J7S9V5_HUIN7|nr:hypothetical protein KNAG_0H03210 [Kazachstania naganishii CBS 8797]CCK71736.1 hypothetical protein KNAG_0H03210 [Kazachstania naganishii CBS 8797]
MLANHWRPVLLRMPLRALHTRFGPLAQEAVTGAAVAAAPAQPKLTKEQLRRRELRKMIRSKMLAKRPASQDKVYLSVPEAMRILRAVEVGQPTSQQTITLTTMVVSEKGVPPLHGDVVLPTPLKPVRIAAFSADPELLKRLQEEVELEIVGGAELIDQLKSGEVPVQFDKAFATPDIAPQLNSKLGALLGRRGLLPNIKKGTVGPDLLAMIRSKVGAMPFRQRAANLAFGIAKCHFSDRQVLGNLIAAREAFQLAIQNQKSKKRSILGRSTLSSTHGPGIVIDLA